VGPIAIVAHGYACNKVACYPAWSGDSRIRSIVLTTLGAVHAYRPDIWATVLHHAAALEGRVLIVQGAIDPLIAATERAEELRRAATRAAVDLVLLEGGNHYFNDRQAQLAACIADWLARAEGASGRTDAVQRRSDAR
jgi:pimeloyl-ACP methyl ester carboxylesterase